MTKVRPGSHIHLMGICGTAMASLAGLLKDRDYVVTGSDANPYPPMSTQLEYLKIPVMNGYRAENLNPKPDFVIVGNVISRNNPEAQEMVRLQIPFTSLPNALGEWIIQEKESIVISGTHGKTTTTSMTAWLLESAGLKPGFLIGGVPKNFPVSFRNPAGNHFVIEGDEYDTAYFDKVPKFIHYRPQHVVLTSIEFDHADIYKDLDHVKSAFAQLVNLIPADGHLFFHTADENIQDVLTQQKSKMKLSQDRIISYGMGTGDLQCRLISENADGIEFEINLHGKTLGQFHTIMSGSYNLLNFTAAIGVSHQLGISRDVIAEGVRSFGGVKRRQEILGEPGGILVIEDFAHHPTAVKETISGLKSKYPERKMFAVFEPRSATSRRRVFQKDYVAAFSKAECVILAKAYDQTKLDEEDRFSSEELIDDLKMQKKNAHVFENADQIVQQLNSQAKAGDLILIMSNGGFDGIYKKLLASLEML